MEGGILKVADYAIEQPGVSGYICVDKEGLCLAARGSANQAMSGIIHQLAELASKIEEPNSKKANNEQNDKVSPVIQVDLERYKLVIQSRDAVTTALLFNHKCNTRRLMPQQEGNIDYAIAKCFISIG